MFSQNNFAPPSLWPNGPTPGGLWNFPGNNGAAKNAEDLKIKNRTQSPITTGTSVLGMVFKGGVMLVADTLGSYGSLAKFRNIERVFKVNDTTIAGASGDIADFQYLKEIIEQKIIDEQCMDDGFNLKPHSLHTWLTRVLYNRRSKFDPLWTTFLVAGMQDGEPFLGFVDKIGTAYTDNLIATGYGAYLALPLMRAAAEKKPQMTKDEAREVLIDAMRVMFYRDARSLNRFQIATVTAEGVTIEGPLAADTNWEVAHLIRGYE